MTQKKSKGWPEIGTIRKNDSGVSYIKLADNVKILIDGEEISLNKFRTVQLQDPRVEVKRLQDLGYLTEEKANERLEKLDNDMAWLRYKLVAPPSND